MSVAAYVVAVLLFCLAGLGVGFDRFAPLDLVAFGLAAFALAHILPG